MVSTRSSNTYPEQSWKLSIYTELSKEGRANKRLLANELPNLVALSRDHLISPTVKVSNFANTYKRE